MQQKQETQEELWNEAKTPNMYYKFEENKKVILGFTNWNLERKQVPDFTDKTKMVERIEFRCDLLVSSKDKTEQYEYSTLSKRFIIALAVYLQPKNPLTDIVFLSIKPIGKGNAIQYDVELVQ